MKRSIGRGLSQQFLTDLKECGSLNDVLKVVLYDDTLCLEIRDNYANIYYRGGNLLRIEESPTGYKAAFDIKYCEHKNIATKYKQQINDAVTVMDYVQMIPLTRNTAANTS